MKYFAVAALALLGLNVQANTNSQVKTVPTAVHAFSIQTQSSLLIKGTYTVAPKAGEKIYLAIVLDKKTKEVQKIDSVNVVDSHFTISPKGIKPGKYEIMNSAGESFPIYLENGQSDITIDSKFAQAKITGNAFDSSLKKYEGINMMVAMAQMGYAFKAMDYQKKGLEVPQEEQDEFVKSYTEIAQNQKKLIRELGARKDLVGAYVLVNGGAGEFTNEEINATYSGLSAMDKETPYGLDLKSYVDKVNSLAVGVKAPDFVQKTPEGTDLRLSEFIKGKKLILVDFWASWCGPCRAENPNVVALYDEFKGKGFDILGVSLDDKRDPWLKAIADDKLTWAQVSDLGGWKNSVAGLYNVKAVPHTILMDENGKILAKNLRGEELRKKVEEICK